MSVEANVWLIGCVGLIVGMVLGALVYRSTRGSSTRSEVVEQRLDALRDEYTKYQASVTEHFATTADLVNRMTESYRQVHEHLASGAHKLCDDQELVSQLTLPSKESVTADSAEEPAPKQKAEAVEPPRDYAPKQHPDEGTLSESYGMARKAEPEPAKP